MALDPFTLFIKGIPVPHREFSVAMSLGFSVQPEPDGKNTGKGILLTIQQKTFTKINQAATLGIDRQPRFSCQFHGLPE